MISTEIHLVTCQQDGNIQKAYFPTAQTSSSKNLLELLLFFFYIFMKDLQILQRQAHQT
jgi:hypothetical protein